MLSTKPRTRRGAKEKKSSPRQLTLQSKRGYVLANLAPTSHQTRCVGFRLWPLAHRPSAESKRVNGQTSSGSSGERWFHRNRRVCSSQCARSSTSTAHRVRRHPSPPARGLLRSGGLFSRSPQVHAQRRRISTALGIFACGRRPEHCRARAHGSHFFFCAFRSPSARAAAVAYQRYSQHTRARTSGTQHTNTPQPRLRVDRSKADQPSLPLTTSANDGRARQKARPSSSKQTPARQKSKGLTSNFFSLAERGALFRPV